MRANKALSGYSHEYIAVNSVFMYKHMQVLISHLFFAYTMCNWLACIAMPRLDIDTRRVVFLKSAAGYSVHKI